MSLSDIPQVLFELLWPFVFVFSFVVLVKARIRRYRSTRRVQFNHSRWLFVVAATVCLGVFLSTGFLVMEPITSSLFLSEKLNKEEANLLFMTGMAFFLVVVPLSITPLVCRFWPAKAPDAQRDKL